MTALEKYNQIFSQNFNVDVSTLNETFSIETIDNWDSLSQMKLITALEEVFDIMFDADDIVAFSSYENGKEILKNYGIIV